MTGRQLSIWFVVLSPLLAFATYLLGVHIAPLLLAGLFGLPVALAAGGMLAQGDGHWVTLSSSVLVLGLGIAALPFALLSFETSTGIRLPDPAGKFMAIGFVVTIPVGAVLALAGSIGLIRAALRRVAGHDAQPVPPEGGSLREPRR